MMRTPFFMVAIDSASTMFLVLSVSGVCRVMKSARLNSSGELDLLDAEVTRAVGRQERIVRNHPHAQALRAVGDDRADIAAADDAERLVGDLDAHEAVLLPLAGLRGDIGLRDLARERQHHGDGVLGGGDRIAERGVHHDDALGSGRRDIDIVDADTGAADHLQPLGALEELGRDLGRRTDGEAVETVDHFGELVLVGTELRLEHGLDAAILEDLDGGVGEGVGDEHFGHGGFLLHLSPLFAGRGRLASAKREQVG